MGRLAMSRSRSTQQGIVTVGVDLAKNVFQVHAIDADGKVLVRRQFLRHLQSKLTRPAPCFHDLNLNRNSVLHGLYVTDHANHPSLSLEPLKRVDREIEAVSV
jgi:hypothetical protein